MGLRNEGLGLVRITNTLTEEGFKSATGKELGMSGADVPSFRSAA
jgi:hypothetical protein